MSATILIVDDEPTQRLLLKGVLVKEGFDVKEADSGADAVSVLQEGFAPDVMLLDLMMPDMDGMAVLKAIRPDHPDLPVIVLTAHASVGRVVDVMRAGANDFLAKPASAERVRKAVASALNKEGMVGIVSGVAERVGRKGTGFDGLIGSAPATQAAVLAAKRAARSAVPVLIEGESGVGKEVFARAIHEESPRSAKPFVAVNCGAIPANLVESLLFGHEKGAFTGAMDKQIGKFMDADGGTLFLDELGELPLETQVKLLRVLQEGEIEPVGARQPVRVDIRLISATNRPLMQMVADGQFREDLYYRLSVFPLALPPLRERREDIPDLARFFAARVAAAEHLPEPNIASDVLAYLARADWPGNIRQLQNAMFRAVVLSETGHLTLDAFDAPQARPMSLPLEADSPSDRPEPAPYALGQQLALCGADGHIRSMEALEQEIICYALEHYQGQLSEVARRLGIGRSTLYRRLEAMKG